MGHSLGPINVELKGHGFHVGNVNQAERNYNGEADVHPGYSLLIILDFEGSSCGSIMPVFFVRGFYEPWSKFLTYHLVAFYIIPI